MAEQANTKRRKIAHNKLKVEIYVHIDEAHRVGGEQFDEWAKNVETIFADASKKVKVESDKLKKAHGSFTIEAPREPFNWRQVRADTNPQ